MKYGYKEVKQKISDEGKKNKQLVQIGNAVPCLLGKAIGLAIRYGACDLA